MSFLTPQDRTLLIESLRPPGDYQLHSAIGTTYSLDLIALMVAPIGFTFFDLDASDSAFQQLDPLVIVEAIRRHASQIVLFCEAGRIAVPRHHRPLLTYLEDRIIEAKAPANGHSFHPKVWIIRYTNSNNQVWYRLLCLSRNLTFDRSWDTVLTLDGQLRSDREKGFSENSGLREFIGALPGMAITSVSADIQEQVSTIESEISRVEWDLSDTPFNFIRFWPLGHTGQKTWPFKGRIQRLIVASPFISGGILNKLSGSSSGMTLISRPECLDKISNTVLDGFETCYQMKSQSAAAEPEDPDTLPGTEALQGLHAKLYIADDGYDGRLWTGSANATASAFGGNVEFMVELAGKKSQIGVSAFLEKVNGVASFSDLLEVYSRPTAITDNTAIEKLEHEIDSLRLPLADAGWTLTATPGQDAQEYVTAASTQTTLPVWGNHISVRFRPLSMDESFAEPLVSAELANAVFKAVSLESLTSFLVMDVRAEQDGNKAAIQFVVNATLIGAPANRRERILQHMLHDRRALMRFLLLLLADVADDPFIAAASQSKSWGKASNSNESSEALLEPLLRALDKSPVRLRAIQALLKDLGSTEEGRRLMPDGLQSLFDAVWSASEESVS